MKKIIITAICLLVAFFSFSQSTSPYLPIGSPAGNSMIGLSMQRGFGVPQVSDTTNIIGQLGLLRDSVGMMVFDFVRNVFWGRVESTPGINKWIQINTGGGSIVGAENGTAIQNDSVVLGTNPLIQNTTLTTASFKLQIEDNPDSSNLLLNNIHSGAGVNNIIIGDGNRSWDGSYNTVVGVKGLKFGNNVNFNAAFGQAALSDANTNSSSAFGIRSSQFVQRDNNVAVGYVANQNSFGAGNTAIGTNAQTAQAILTDVIDGTEVVQGDSIFTGTTTASFIASASLNIGDTMIFNVQWASAPIDQDNPLQSLGIITNSNTITFLNQPVFPVGTYVTGTTKVYDKQDNSIALGVNATALSSNQFAISDSIENLKMVGVTGASNSGYVLTTDGTGIATFQPSGAAALTHNAIGFGSITNTLTGNVDSASYDIVNRIMSLHNSFGGTTISSDQVAFAAYNDQPSTSLVTENPGDIIMSSGHARKTNATAGDQQGTAGFRAHPHIGASVINLGMDFVAGTNSTFPNTVIGTFTTNGFNASNVSTGSISATTGNADNTGTVGASTLLSANDILIQSANSNNTITFQESGQQLAQFASDGTLLLQNKGTLPSNPADGGQFNIYLQSGVTGIGTVTITTGTAAVTGTNTKFTKQFQPNDQMTFANPNTETATILSITDDTHIVLTGNVANSHTGATFTITPATARKFIVYNNGLTPVYGTPTNDAAASGIIGEEINSTVSTYTNYTTTATYQNITSIALTPGDWDISAFFTYSSNSATITAASNAIFVISTTTASAAGATEGQSIDYVPQAALLGTSKFSDGITPYRVSIAVNTTYYLNTQATFTLGNPQYVGSIRARRIR